MAYSISLRTLAIALAGAALTAGCGGGGSPDVNFKPSFVGTVSKTTYNGTTDDLLTAGLGTTGLGGATPPTIANPTAPTAAELRKLAIFNNYRAIVPVAPNGGYGRLFGPNIDASGNPTLGDGKIAGTEYIAYADDGSGRQNVTMLVQIPASFNRDKACIVTAASSGSRGVYGAIGSAGEWGLKRGCAVAYTDKGGGHGVHDLTPNTVNLQTGVRASATTAGKDSNFTASLSAADLATFNAAFPNRQAVKHAHSQQNPEKDWGRDTLNAIRFAFFALNEQFGDPNSDGTFRNTFKPDNTVVIASSVSNGAGSSLAAAEQDTEGLIDGIAVSEPQVQLQPGGALTVVQGGVTRSGTGRPLYDSNTLGNLYQPCATLAAGAANSPGAIFVPTALATSRCASLKAKGLLSAATTAEQGNEALNVLVQAGFQPESNILHASHYAFVTPAIVVTYANAYGRFSVADNLCGFSFAGVDAMGRPAPLAAAALAQVFGTGNGIPPTAGIAIINNLNPTGPIRDAASVSPSTGLLDFNIDGALCHRNLWTDADAKAMRVQAGVREVYRTANLRGKPAIIVHGRADLNLPVGFTSRPYYGQNKIVEGATSKLTYIEVTNAQHLDAFIDNPVFAGYDTRFVPLHHYFIQAMDRMYAHLTANAPLPPAQVVRGVPRGGTPGMAPAITAANVPAISQTPAAGDQIVFSGSTLTIPN
ncbi:MAG: D-(-)-3-hydroxybutyrate oligomer hydrolase [Casimicrobiaceae bacterium]